VLFPAPAIIGLWIKKGFKDQNWHDASTGRPGRFPLDVRGQNNVKNDSIVMRIVRVMMTLPQRLCDVQFNVAAVGDLADANPCVPKIRSAVGIQ
jgi:hypothetical protein